MIVLRVLVGVVLALIFGIAVIPLFVLLDFADGGTGWGICPDGIASCRTSYFDGFELLAVLVVILFALLGILQLALKGIRRLERQREEAGPGGRRDVFGAPFARL